MSLGYILHTIKLSIRVEEILVEKTGKCKTNGNVIR